MTEREALKIALQALKTIDEAMPFPVAKLAQSAIKEALAQQSAQRTWVDLTKEECFELCVKHKDEPFSLLVAVQDKLKEKNCADH